MLYVRTEVKPSPIHGLGLFATHNIAKGQTVWQFNPSLDIRYTEAYLDTIPECVADQIRKYRYINPEYREISVLCGDDARFMNFAALSAETHEGGVATKRIANLALGEKRDDEYTLIAARYIAAGEELTVPLDSDADAERKLSTSI